MLENNLFILAHLYVVAGRVTGVNHMPERRHARTRGILFLLTTKTSTPRLKNLILHLNPVMTTETVCPLERPDGCS